MRINVRNQTLPKIRNDHRCAGAQPALALRVQANRMTIVAEARRRHRHPRYTATGGDRVA